MGRLKLGALVEDRPVRLTIELPAEVHRDLLAYAQILASGADQHVTPARLIAPMLAHFMASDREFSKAKRSVAAR